MQRRLITGSPGGRAGGVVFVCGGMAKKSTKPMRKGKKKGAARPAKDPMLTKREPIRMASGLNVRVPPTAPWLRLAHGHLNPFLDDAMGLKVPDNNSSESFTYRTVGRYMYLADGISRYGGHTFAPSLLQESTNWTTGSSPTAAWANASSTQNGGYNNIIAASQAVRIVSWGVRIFCTCSYDKANGQVVIATKRGASGPALPGTAPNNSQVVDPNGWVHWEVVALKDLDHVWTSEKMFKEGAEAYSDPTGLGISTTPDMAWTNLVVFLLPNGGAESVPPAGCAYGFEVVKNLECLPLVGTIANGLTSPAAVADPRVSSLVNRVQASTPPVLTRERHGPTMLSALYSGVKALALDAVGWAMPHVGRGISRMVQGRHQAIMDVD